MGQRSHSSLTIQLCLGGFLVLGAVASPADVASQEMIDRYVSARETQQSVLRGAQMEVAIDAKLPRLAKQGTLERCGDVEVRKNHLQGVGIFGRQHHQE